MKMERKMMNEAARAVYPEREITQWGRVMPGSSDME